MYTYLGMNSYLQILMYNNIYIYIKALSDLLIARHSGYTLNEGVNNDDKWKKVTV
jgi:hypothetical protein